MTTATVTYHTGPRFSWRLLLFVALLTAVIFGAHAVAKHGSDAEAVRRACNDNGHYQLWQALERPGKYYRVCKVDTGVFGLQIVECTARGIRERTSFIPGKSQLPAGSMARVIEYVSAKAVQVAVIGGLCK